MHVCAVCFCALWKTCSTRILVPPLVRVSMYNHACVIVNDIELYVLCCGVGVDFKSKIVQFNGNRVKLSVWVCWNARGYIQLRVSKI